MRAEESAGLVWELCDCSHGLFSTTPGLVTDDDETGPNTFKFVLSRQSMNKKTSAFNEAKPRTPKGEARQREIKAAKAMEELVEIGDEDEYKRRLAERFGIRPGHPRYEQAVATWRELRAGKP